MHMMCLTVPSTTEITKLYTSQYNDNNFGVWEIDNDSIIHNKINIVAKKI